MLERTGERTFEMWTTTDTVILFGFWMLPALCVLAAGVSYWFRNRSNAPDQARLQPSPEAGCSAFPFALRAADRMSAIIDEMVRDGQLDARSRLADARLDYGKPWAYAHTPNKVI
jgi:hypothetical protein